MTHAGTRRDRRVGVAPRAVRPLLGAGPPQKPAPPFALPGGCSRAAAGRVHPERVAEPPLSPAWALGARREAEAGMGLIFAKLWSLFGSQGWRGGWPGCGEVGADGRWGGARGARGSERAAGGRWRLGACTGRRPHPEGAPRKSWAFLCAPPWALVLRRLMLEVALFLWLRWSSSLLLARCSKRFVYPGQPFMLCAQSSNSGQCCCLSDVGFFSAVAAEALMNN